MRPRKTIRMKPIYLGLILASSLVIALTACAPSATPTVVVPTLAPLASPTSAVVATPAATKPVATPTVAVLASPTAALAKPTVGGAATSAAATVAPTRAATSAAAVATATVAGAAAATGNPTAGQTVFQTNCNSCHPNGKAGVGPALSGVVGKLGDAGTRSVIRNGRSGTAMPAFSTSQISDQQLNDLIAYLNTL